MLPTALLVMLAGSPYAMDEVNLFSLPLLIIAAKSFPAMGQPTRRSPHPHPLESQGATRSFHENVAVSIGRIGLTLVASHLVKFAQAWCQAPYGTHDNEEKDAAFWELYTMIEVNL